MICVGILLALLAPFFGYTLASPIRPAPVARSRTGWGWNVEDLENEFKGLWWQEAFKAEECNDEQLDKIIFATRYAMKMMQKPGPEENIALSKAWTRYFGPYISWQQFGIDNHNQAAEIQSNIRNAQEFPTQGKPPYLKKHRIHYTCKPYQSSANSCNTPGVRAATTKPLGSQFNAWTITFCPAFFTDTSLRYLEERSNEPRLASEIGDMDTYERIISHEFMHVDIVGTKTHIEDIKGSTYGGGDIVDIYGEIRCRDYALRYAPRPNPNVVINADSYSWFFLFFWYEKLFDWNNQSKRNLPEAVEVHLNARDEEEHIDEPSFPANEDEVEPGTDLPANCQELDETDEEGNKKIYCDYVGMDYTEWVSNLGNPFESAGGCELSPECHKSFGRAVDPSCTCKCDDDPLTPLRDERCVGFAGSLPTPPGLS